MTAHELHTQLQSEPAPTLLHVLPEEIFAAAHIPGSLQACIFEMAFLEKVRALGLDPAAPLIVYGAGAGSLDAATAAESLRAAGFTRVQTYEGGLADWTAAGLPLAGTGQFPAEPLPHGTYTVDPKQSIIRWTGRNLFNHHHGTVRLAGGHIQLEHGRLIGARFTIAMTTIACEDLGDPALNALLLTHLGTADFFDTAAHPTAEFLATRAEPLVDTTPGTPNYLLHGQFTLRGLTRELAFPILVAAKDEALHLTGQATLDLDRTAYGSHYGSGKFFRYLAGHLVNDHVHLHVKIHAELMS